MPPKRMQQARNEYDEAVRVADAEYDKALQGLRDIRRQGKAKAQQSYNAALERLAEQADKFLEQAGSALYNSLRKIDGDHNSAVAAIDQTHAKTIQAAMDARQQAMMAAIREEAKPDGSD